MVTPGTGLFPRRSNQDPFVAGRPVERFAVCIDPELVMVNTVGAQIINLGYFFVKRIDQSLLLGLKLYLSQLTLQALNKVPRRVKLLLEAQREWVHNGVGEIKAFTIVYSMPVGIERGVFKIEVGHARKQTTQLKVSHNFNTQWLRANLGASLIRIGHSASPSKLAVTK